jgi:hypothetical protein
MAVLQSRRAAELATPALAIESQRVDARSQEYSRGGAGNFTKYFGMQCPKKLTVKVGCVLLFTFLHVL